MKSCESLKGGLNRIAETLEVKRVGPSHQAGSDSLVTSLTFFKMARLFFENNIDESKYSVSAWACIFQCMCTGLYKCVCMYVYGVAGSGGGGDHDSFSCSPTFIKVIFFLASTVLVADHGCILFILSS